MGCRLFGRNHPNPNKVTMLLKIIRLVSRIILRLIANIETIGDELIPQTGGCIVASNHLGRLDALLAIVLTDRPDVVLMIAEKYQNYAFWRWVARELDALWLNRYEADFHALRQVHKRLRQGELLAMAPEGTRSSTGALIPGKPGAAYLAAKAGVPVVPVALTGTEDGVVKERLRRLRRLHIRVEAGPPFTLPPMPRQGRDAYLQAHTDEIMCRIAAMLPPSYRGIYTDHPRLQDLLSETV
jgi:1-acyl-sn-glycerol-3-phosphate acyltransferase